ncbi:MAG TPA: hypothetical protein VK157_15715 [Phycisphaerales bacterium]|nr:hypothetical protein [Phycisphaerales bacterium]
MNICVCRANASIGVIALSLLASAAIGQPSLTWVGTPLQVVDASADGTALVGTGGTQIFTGSDPAYYWSTSGGLVLLPINGGGGLVNRAGVGGMSDDGRLIIGSLYNTPGPTVNYPVTWDVLAPGAIGTYLTPVNATGRGTGGDISADGARMAALYELSSPATISAFIRDRVGGTWTALDAPSTQRRFTSVVLSRSAQHACGGYFTTSPQNILGFIWSASGGFTPIALPAGFPSFNPRAISDNGNVIAGVARLQSTPSTSLFTPFLWTQGPGYRVLPLPLPAVTGLVNDLSGDGLIGVGHVGDSASFSNSRAVAWTPQGVFTVAQLAVQAGVNVANVQFLTANVIAADGSFVIGSGSRRVGATTLLDTYILRNVFIPRCDSVDFNRNGIFPEDQDIVDFVSVYTGNACSTGAACGDADFNNDGMFPQDQDVIDFFQAIAGEAC